MISISKTKFCLRKPMVFSWAASKNQVLLNKTNDFRLPKTKKTKKTNISKSLGSVKHIHKLLEMLFFLIFLVFWKRKSLVFLSKTWFLEAAQLKTIGFPKQNFVFEVEIIGFLKQNLVFRSCPTENHWFS